MGRPKESMVVQCKNRNCRKWVDKSSVDKDGVCINCRKNRLVGTSYG